MFEHCTEPLLSRLQFVWRLCKALSLTILVAALSLIGGTLGYYFLVGSDWSDSFHNACLVLGNHDVVTHPESALGKVFVGLYVMYGGLLFVSMVAILASPVLHRIIHSLRPTRVRAGAMQQTLIETMRSSVAALDVINEPVFGRYWPQCLSA